MELVVIMAGISSLWIVGLVGYFVTCVLDERDNRIIDLEERAYQAQLYKTRRIA